MLVISAGNDEIGGDPRLVFTDEAGKEIKKVDISALDSDGIEAVLNQNGFMRKQQEQTAATGSDSAKTPEMYGVEGEQKKAEKAEL